MAGAKHDTVPFRFLSLRVMRGPMASLGPSPVDPQGSLRSRVAPPKERRTHGLRLPGGTPKSPHNINALVREHILFALSLSLAPSLSHSLAYTHTHSAKAILQTRCVSHQSTSYHLDRSDKDISIAAEKPCMSSRIHGCSSSDLFSST